MLSRMRSILAAPALAQASTAAAPLSPPATMVEVILRSASRDGIKCTVEREAVEIIRDRNGARRRDQRRDTEMRVHGEICCRDIRHRAFRARRDQNDIRRKRQNRQIGDAPGQFLGHFRRQQFTLARIAHLRNLFRQHFAERRIDGGDAVAIMLDDSGKPLRQIDIAQEPDEAIEQQILHRAIEFKLHIARAPYYRAHRCRC